MNDLKSIINRHKFNMLLKVLSVECEVRGTDASGIAYNCNDRL